MTYDKAAGLIVAFGQVQTGLAHRKGRVAKVLVKRGRATIAALLRAMDIVPVDLEVDEIAARLI